MFRVLFVIGLICYATLLMAGKLVTLEYKRKGYKSTSVSSKLEGKLLQIKLFIICQIPIINIILFFTCLFLDSNKIIQSMYDKGEIIKISEEEGDKYES